MIVLAEAVGSSLTPFVPVPFVDDYLFERLLRRVSRKVLERRNIPIDKPLSKALVEAYLAPSKAGLGEAALTAAARFVIRKVAVVLDVKKSHDVFGEAIAFGLAIDIAGPKINAQTAAWVGTAIYHAREAVGSAAIELLTRAGRDAFKSDDGTPLSQRASRVGDAVGRQVDETRAKLEAALNAQGLSQIRA